jgi:hypothetical protein
MGCSSKTGVQLAPAFNVFQTPPEAAPMYIVFGSATTASMVVIRPLIPAGPIFLGFQLLNWSNVFFCAMLGDAKNNVPNPKQAYNTFCIFMFELFFVNYGLK